MAQNYTDDDQITIESLKIELSKSRNDLALAEMALSKSKTECSALQSEKFDLEDQLLVRDDKINELQRDLSEIINQRKKTNAQNDDIQKQIQHFQSEIVKKENEIENLNKTLFDRDQEIKSCNLSIKNASNQIDRLNEELEKYQNENFKLKKDSEHLLEKNEELATEISRLNQELSTLDRLLRNNKSFAEEYREKELDFNDNADEEKSLTNSIHFVKVTRETKGCGAVPNCDGKGNTNGTSKTHRKPEYCPYRKTQNNPGDESILVKINDLEDIHNLKKRIKDLQDLLSAVTQERDKILNSQSKEDDMKSSNEFLKADSELANAKDKIDKLSLENKRLEREIGHLKSDPLSKFKLLYKQKSQLREISDEQSKRVLAVLSRINEIDEKSRSKTQDFFSKLDHIENAILKKSHQNEICNVCTKTFASKNGVSIHKANMEKLSYEEVFIIIHILMNLI